MPILSTVWSLHYSYSFAVLTRRHSVGWKKIYYSLSVNACETLQVAMEALLGHTSGRSVYMRVNGECKTAIVSACRRMQLSKRTAVRKVKIRTSRYVRRASPYKVLLYEWMHSPRRCISDPDPDMTDCPSPCVRFRLFEVFPYRSISCRYLENYQDTQVRQKHRRYKNEWKIRLLN